MTIIQQFVKLLDTWGIPLSLAVTTAGCWALLSYRSSDRRLVIFWLLLLIGIGWRLFANTLLSSRYFCMLILLGTILAALPLSNYHDMTIRGVKIHRWMTLICIFCLFSEATVTVTRLMFLRTSKEALFKSVGQILQQDTQNAKRPGLLDFTGNGIRIAQTIAPGKANITVFTGDEDDKILAQAYYGADVAMVFDRDPQHMQMIRKKLLAMDPRLKLSEIRSHRENEKRFFYSFCIDNSNSTIWGAEIPTGAVTGASGAVAVLEFTGEKKNIPLDSLKQLLKAAGWRYHESTATSAHGSFELKKIGFDTICWKNLSGLNLMSPVFPGSKPRKIKIIFGGNTGGNISIVAYYQIGGGTVVRQEIGRFSTISDMEMRIYQKDINLPAAAGNAEFLLIFTHNNGMLAKIIIE